MRLGGFVLCAAVWAGSAMAAQDRYGDPLPDGAAQRLGTQRMRYASGIADLCYLPDGRGAFAVGGRVEICDLVQGRLQSAQVVCKASIVSIAPRSDGKALLVADSGGNAHE